MRDVTVSTIREEEVVAPLWRLWQQGQRPDVRRFLAEVGPLGPAQTVAVLRVDQQQRWRAGERVPAEEYLGLCPALESEPELALELIYGEYLLREELGESPAVEEYERRFPSHAIRLRQQIDLRRALESVSPQTRTSLGTSPRPSVAAMPSVAGYEILEILGRGGMGVVYRARHVALDRVVALKMILAGAHADPEQLARFRGEAEAVARFQHPNIVQIHEVGEQDGLPWFSLEFVAGCSLSDAIDGKPQPARSSAEVIAVVAGAVHYAHERGVVHRDLKPANVLLSLSREPVASALVAGSRLNEAVPKITDFGLAKRLDQSATPTVSGAVMGTPSYMAPEQAAGKVREVGPLSDVYALGAVLYELLTGRPPFLGETPVDTLLQVIHSDPVPPSRLQPTCPRDLETICLKCLRKEPPRRYASAADLADDLRRLLRHEPIRARPIGLAERGLKWARRHPAIAALAATVLVVAVLGFGGVTLAWRGEVFQRLRAEGAESAALTEAEAARLAREAALVAKQAEEEAHKKTDQARKEAEDNLYSRSVVLAEREWLAGNVDQAERILNGCPPSHRHWEWRYLKRICHTELSAFRAEAGSRPAGVFSPDGRCFAAAGDDLRATAQTVTVWDVATGQVRSSLRGHDGQVRVLVMSGDGKLLAAVTWTEMKLWDLTAGKELHKLRGHTSAVTAVGFSPDGKRLASAGADAFKAGGLAPGEVRLWDVATGRTEQKLEGHNRSVMALAFSPEGKTLATGSGDSVAVAGNVPLPGFKPPEPKASEVKLWDTATGRNLHTLPGHTGQVSGLVFSPDGKRLVSATMGLTTLGVANPTVKPGQVKVWDVDTGRETATLSTQHFGMLGPVFNREGDRLAVGGAEGGQAVRVWAGSGGSEVYTLRGHSGSVTGVAFSPDGKSLATSSQDKTVKVWDARSGKELFTLRGHSVPVQRVAFGPDGKTLGSASGREVKVWDAVASRESRPFRGHSLPVYSVAFNGNGQLASGGADGTVKLWDPATGRVEQTLGKSQMLPFGGFGAVWSVAFSPDGRRLAWCTREVKKPGLVYLRDMQAGKEAATLRGHTGEVRAVAFDRDGTRLASGGTDGSVRVWDVATASEMLALSGHPGWVMAVAFSPNGQLLVAGVGGPGRVGQVRLWDARSGKEVRTLSGHAHGVNGVAVSPDGRQVAVASGEFRKGGELKVWDVASGELLHSLEGHTDSVSGAAFSTDGKRLASSSLDGTVKLWDPFRGKELLTLRGHFGDVYSVAFSPDTTRLATGTAGQVVEVWDAPLGDEQPRP